MDSTDKALMLWGCVLCGFLQISVALVQYELPQNNIMGIYIPPIGEQCSWGCNKENTRCVETPDGCGRGFKSCQCKDGYRMIGGVCKKYRDVKSGCSEETDICPQGAACTDGICECPGDIYSKDEEVCGRRYQEKCATSSECNIQRGNMTCQTGECLCAPGLAYQEDHGKKCLPVGGAACTYQHQCYGGQSCNGGSCQCPSGQKWDGESFMCVGSNALTGVPRGDACTPDFRQTNAKVCTYGHFCVTCNPVLPLHRCVKLPMSAGSRPSYFLPLSLFTILVSINL